MRGTKLQFKDESHGDDMYSIGKIVNIIVINFAW